MSTDATAEQPRNDTRVLEFARAFRTAARAVSFYPPTHQTVVTALAQVMATAAAATARGSLCLTILPQAFLAGGVPVDTSETVVADLAALCHRHGVGALNLDGAATLDAWRALFLLLARKSEDVRSAGGIQREWRAQRHRSPAILEIDFGALLRGQVGGDFIELAGVISHYLETAGVGGSILDDPSGALRRAIESAADETQAVAGILRELRAAAQLTWTQPEQFDDVFRRAAAAGEFLTEGIMEALLGLRGTADAMVGAVDVVSALIDRMPDATVSRFLTRVMGGSGSASSRLADVFSSLVPDANRRRMIVLEARDVTLDGNVIEQWAELERNLEAYVDHKFISDQYNDELHSAQSRAEHAGLEAADPPERLAAWVRSIDDEAIYELDLQLLADLARIETEESRSRKVLEILHGHVLEATDASDWTGVTRTLEAITGVASGSADATHRLFAAEILQRLAGSRMSEQALGMIGEVEPPLSDTLSQVLCAIGAPLVPAIARRWAGGHDVRTRSRLEAVVVACGRHGREALRRLLASENEAAEVRVAAIRLLNLTPGTDHLPVLEAALTNQHEAIRREAFGALANSSSDRAFDILARGIARADAATQATLVARLAEVGDGRALPVLQRLLQQVDPRRVPVPVYLSMIAAVERTGSEGAAALLTSVIRRTQWRAPYRAWRFRSAARSALRVLRDHGTATFGGTPPSGVEPATPAAPGRETDR